MGVLAQALDSTSAYARTLATRIAALTPTAPSLDGFRQLEPASTPQSFGPYSFAFSAGTGALVALTDTATGEVRHPHAMALPPRCAVLDAVQRAAAHGVQEWADASHPLAELVYESFDLYNNYTTFIAEYLCVTPPPW